MKKVNHHILKYKQIKHKGESDMTMTQKDLKKVINSDGFMKTIVKRNMFLTEQGKALLGLKKYSQKKRIS